MTLPPVPEQEHDDSLERFRTYVVYGTAGTLVIGGSVGLFLLMWFDRVTETVALGTLGPLIGGAAIFLFGAVQAKQTERAMERANIVARSTIGPNGHGTEVNTTAPVTTGGPTTVMSPPEG